MTLISELNEEFATKDTMNMMLINVSTRRFRRAVRLPEGDVPAPQDNVDGFTRNGQNAANQGTKARVGKMWLEFDGPLSLAGAWSESLLSRRGWSGRGRAAHEMPAFGI
jgi:hypothetical protein